MRTLLLVLAVFALSCGSPSTSTSDGGLEPGPDRSEPSMSGADGGGLCDARQTRCGETCVDLSKDLKHCGACGKACAAGEGCTEGKCLAFPADCRQGPCPTTHYCELSTGKCQPGCASELQCPEPEFSAATCVGHACGFTCGQGRHSCGGACPKLNSLSACGNACSVCDAAANQTPVCNYDNKTEDYACARFCIDGFADCDKEAANGCEQSVRLLNHCGACNKVCNPAHATPTCARGVCAYERCESGWIDCDGNYANGCETPSELRWKDGDLDGFGTPTSTREVCPGWQLTGYLDAGTPPDCDDANANAFPGQTSYFGVRRADGGFDYNCDGKEELTTREAKTSCASEKCFLLCGTYWDSATPPPCGALSKTRRCCPNTNSLGACIAETSAQERQACR